MSRIILNEHCEDVAEDSYAGRARGWRRGKGAQHAAPLQSQRRLRRPRQRRAACCATTESKATATATATARSMLRHYRVKGDCNGHGNCAQHAAPLQSQRRLQRPRQLRAACCATTESKATATATECESKDSPLRKAKSRCATCLALRNGSVWAAGRVASACATGHWADSVGSLASSQPEMPADITLTLG